MPRHGHGPCGGYRGVGIGPAHRHGILGWSKFLRHSGSTIYISFPLFFSLSMHANNVLSRYFIVLVVCVYVFLVYSFNIHL